MQKLKFLWLVLILSISACSTIQAPIKETTSLSGQQRQQSLSKINDWHIKAKLALINGKKRQSANLNWHYHGSNKSQQLNLTTFLGINILQLESANGQHIIEVDGKSHRGEDLELLIYQLTGFRLPATAKSQWLKGIPFLASDKVHFNNDQTPKSLISNYAGLTWSINYSAYKLNNSLPMATKITIKQNNLTIKLAINKWKINS